MRKICFITGTRADYGIMAPLMKKIMLSSEAELQIIATNMHLSPDHGFTIQEIENDGFKVDEKIESLIASDTPAGIVKSMGLLQIGLADALPRLKPDLIVILGDRYEMLAAASAALIFGIPVAHLHGGEITEGAFDNNIRNAITKLSYLHFAATEEYAGRIVSMGEPEERVWWTGALGVENISNEETLSLCHLEKSINFKLGDKYFIVTFHPVTLQPGEEKVQINSLLSALDTFIHRGYKILITLPNSDTGNHIIREEIKKWNNGKEDYVKTIDSLGRKRFFSALKYASAIIGNSSSALIEAPSFRIPSVNIGDRQKGRAKGISVVDCSPNKESIINAINKAISPEFKEKLNLADESMLNPYYKEGTTNLILNLLLGNNI